MFGPPAPLCEVYPWGRALSELAQVPTVPSAWLTLAELSQPLTFHVDKTGRCGRRRTEPSASKPRLWTLTAQLATDDSCLPWKFVWKVGTE